MRFETICNDLQIKPEATEYLSKAYRKLQENYQAEKLLKKTMTLFWHGFYSETGSELEPLDCVSRIAKIHHYTIYEIFYLLCIPEAKKQYGFHALSDIIFYDTFAELRYKMEITHNIRGIWGCEYAPWFKGFFQLRRFCLGRLEFEIIPSEYDYKCNGFSVSQGEPVINVHIPEAGPLPYRAVLESYQRAGEFFADCFLDSVIPFQCNTWILYPLVTALFPEGNLKKFANDYVIINSAELNAEEDDRWRIFQVSPEKPIEDYPEDTRLQRELKKYLMNGNKMGISTGVFFMKNGETILH